MALSFSQLKRIIKEYFHPGEVPTAAEFGELIDLATHASALDAGTVDNARLPTQIDLTSRDNPGSITTNTLSADTFSATGITAATISATATLNANSLSASAINTTHLTASDITTSSLQCTTFNSDTLTGKGSGLTHLNAGYITTGTLNNARIPEQIDLTGRTYKSKLTLDELVATDISGTTLTADTLTGDTLAGNGANLTHLHGDNITTGTVDNARLPTHINITKVTAEGSAITAIHAGNIATGTLNNLRLPEQVDLTALGSSSAITVKQVNTVGSTLSGSLQFANGPAVNATSGDGTLNSNRNTALPTEYAVKTYIDNRLSLLEAGLKFKTDVQCVATAEININDTGVLPVIDGYQVQNGDRVLLTSQTDKIQQRVYIARSGQAWIPADDFDGMPAAELFVGVAVNVLNGDLETNRIWSVGDVTGSGSTATLNWRRRNDINDYQASNGITINSMTISSDTQWLETNLDLSRMTKGTLPASAIPDTTAVSSASTHSEFATAAAVHNYVKQVLPAGIIMLWSGSQSDIPAGWTLCNGSNGTPNLVNRFIRGASSNSNTTGGSTTTSADGSVSKNLSATAYSHSHALTISQIPSHSHGYSDYYYQDINPPESQYATANGDDIGQRVSSNRTTSSTGGSAGHSHPVTVNPIGLSIPNHTHTLTPPYYALCYIMKL